MISPSSGTSLGAAHWLRRASISRVALLAVIGVSAATAVVWGTSAGAGPSGEPAAFARAASLTVGSQTMTAPDATASALLGRKLVLAATGGRNASKAAQAGPQTAGIVVGGGDEIIAAVTGPLVPVAVRSKDGSLIAYSSWHQIAQLKPDTAGQGLRTGDPVGVPSIRVYDSSKGDRLIARGAYSPALSLDGRLAFVKGDHLVVAQNQEYTGQVMVGNSSGSSFTAWTNDSARYFPYAWAGHSLLAYRAIPDSEATDLYAYTGPGTSHLVAADASVIALAPDGARVLITTGRRVVEVVRVRDGAVESSMALDGPGVAEVGSPSTPHALMYSGSWFGTRVVANSDVGLVVLNVEGGIRIESVFATPYPHGVIEPTFTDDSQVIGWVDVAPVQVGKHDEPAYDDALVSCDLGAGACAQSSAQPARSWTRWITNPSR